MVDAPRGWARLCVWGEAKGIHPVYAGIEIIDWTVDGEVTRLAGPIL